MSDFKSLRDILQYRISENPDNYFVDALWDEEVRIFCTDTNLSFQFISKKCTDEELYYLSEVFDFIAEETRSDEFLQCLRERAERVENPDWKRDILQCIEDAVPFIEGDAFTLPL